MTRRTFSRRARILGLVAVSLALALVFHRFTGLDGEPPSSTPPGMIFIPGGRYVTGSGLPGELPKTEVVLEPFYIDRLPMTPGRLKTDLAPGRLSEQDRNDFYSPRAQGALDLSGAFEGADDAPVTHVSHTQAARIASLMGRRLPTEEEWEAAARGPRGLLYPLGNEWNPSLYTQEPLLPVGTHPQWASPFGVEDMMGNVSHWTSTPCQGFGLPGEYGGPAHVVKGGAWTILAPLTRYTYRTAIRSDWKSPYIGFRCVLPAGPDDANLRLALSRDYALDERYYSVSEANRQMLAPEVDPMRRCGPQLLSHIKALPRGATVADVGCGVGFLTFILADAVGPQGRVYAEDIDASVLEFVAARAGGSHAGKVEVRLSSPGDIGIPAGTCDEVYLMGTIHFLRKHEFSSFFTSCRSALRSGGLLVVEEYRGHVLGDALAAIPRCGFRLVEETPDGSRHVLRIYERVAMDEHAARACGPRDRKRALRAGQRGLPGAGAQTGIEPGR